MNDSILLIQSKKPNKSSMGTGFVIANDKDGSFVLTCNHVIEAVEEPKIDDYDVEIVVQDEIYDMAVLRVKGLLEKSFILKEQNNLMDKEVSFFGYRQFKKNAVHRLNSREATILTSGRHKNNNTYFSVWEIIAKDNNDILKGYSGSPLIFDDKVIGMMTDRENSERGFAINIKHLADIWKDMPLNLKPKNPFVGLRAFRKEDIKHFFGRDKEIDEIVSKLEDNNFLAVVGDSGSGKSSVVKAGVIPFYESKGYAIVEMRPANDPFIEFKSEIGKVSKLLNYSSFDITNYKKEISIDNSFENIRSILEQIFQEKHQVVLLYIDQFEELFTSYSDKSEENQKKFLGLLLYLVNNQSSKLVIKILFTMRNDYYSLLKKYEIIEHIEANQEANKYTIRRMEDDKLKETIYKPLLVVDLLNEEEAKEFAEFVVQGMGSKDNEITLLQISMTQTYNNFEESKDLFDAYRKIGSVSGALQELATNTMEVIDNKEILKTIFIRLIHFDKDKHNHTRRVADKLEFSNEQWKLIQLLSSALNKDGEISHVGNEKLGRLLKLSKVNDENTQTVELVHEALITGWTTYNDWIGEVEYFKSLHNLVIAKTKAYNLSSKKRSFLLMGADLDDSKSLLGRQYRDFLSEDEKFYLLESKKFEEEEKQKQKELIRDLEIKEQKNQTMIENLEVEKRKSKKLINGLFTFLVLSVGLMGLSLYLKFEAEKSEEKTLKLLDESTKIATEIVEEDNSSLAIKTFRFVVDELNSSLESRTLKILVTAKFGIGLMEQRVGNYSLALREYKYVYSKKNLELGEDIQLLMIKGLFNSILILRAENNATEAVNLSAKLIHTFKDSKNIDILHIVAEAWYNKSLLEIDIEDKQKTLFYLIDFFEKNKDNIIQEQMFNAYATSAWFMILQGKYTTALKLGKKGEVINNQSIGIKTNLTLAYLLDSQVENALKIYRKYKKSKEYREGLDVDLIELDKKNISSIHLNMIKKLLKKKD